MEYAIAGDDADERALTGMPMGAMATKFQVEPEEADRAALELLEIRTNPETAWNRTKGSRGAPHRMKPEY